MDKNFFVKGPFMIKMVFCIKSHVLTLHNKIAVLNVNIVIFLMLLGHLNFKLNHPTDGGTFYK